MTYRILSLLSAFAAMSAWVTLTGCASSDAGMSSFVGQPSSELLARLGSPRLRIPGENGGQIWTYMEEGHVAQSAPVLPGSLHSSSGATPRSSALASPAFSSKKQFFIDSSGMIYKYQGAGH